MMYSILVALAIQLFNAQTQLANSTEIHFSETISMMENGDSIVNPFPQNYQSLTDSVPDILATQLQSPFHFQREKVYLHFDRTFFKPGEAIWFNAYVRDANTLLPSQKSNIVYVELLAPNGNMEKKLTLYVKDGVVAGDIQLHPEAIGGRYKIKAYTNWQRNFDEHFEHDLTVQTNILPNLRMELDFQRKAYGAGDEAVADLTLKSLENEVLANHAFTYTVSLAGQQIFQKKSKTDSGGKAKINYQLPKKLTTNDGLLNVLIDWNGQTESIARSIPIVLNKIDLQFLPEGGNIVADLASRVAFKALNEFGKPADITGQIFDEAGQIVADFKSYHQGMGAFDFEPKTGMQYSAKITQPEGISEVYFLPKVLEKGANFKVLSIDEAFLTVQFNAKGVENSALVLHNAGEIFYARKTFGQTNQFSSIWKIPIKNVPAGIAQLTVFDKNNQPQAERLVFLNPHKKLQIELKTDKENYLPREKVTMDILVKDEDGNPAAGQFSLSVADDQLLSFADDKQGNILAALWLESELKGEVIEPNFYFEAKEKHPEKDQLLALDYLLMTQGWRRFDWKQEKRALADFEFKNENRIVSGFVKNEWDKPMPNVEIRLGLTNEIVQTDATGQFVFENPPIIKGHSSIFIKNGDLQKRFTIFRWGDDYVFQFYDDRKVEFSHQPNSDGMTNLSGKVSESNSGDPVIFGSIALYQNDILITGVESDFEGFYSFDSINPGNYDVEVSYVGFPTKRITGVVVTAENDNTLNIELQAGIQLDEVVVIGYQVPLVEQDNTVQGATISMNRNRPMPTANVRKKTEKKNITEKVQAQTLTSDEIKRRPVRGVNALAASTAGVSSADDGGDLSIRGSRSNATNYYLDGIRISGRTIPPQVQKDRARLAGGTPAEFANDKEMKEALIADKTLADRLDNANYGGRSPIIVRGSYLVNNKKPLYILDGAIVEEKEINKVKPQKIRNTQVLKDSIAIDIYGEKARDGVVFINTNEGMTTGKELAGAAKLTKVLEKLNAENETLSLDFLEKETAFQIELQSGLVTELNSPLPQQELNRIHEKITALQKQIRLFENVLSIELQNQGSVWISQALANYNKALNFKNGIYNPRHFYSPKYTSTSPSETRTDFRNTIYWNPNIITDASGKATVEFYNSDALTTFKAVAEGIGETGEIGRGEMTYFTQQPIGMQVKIPTNLMTGDVVEIPVTISNNSNEKMMGNLMGTVPKGLHLLDKPNEKLVFSAKESKTVLLKYQILDEPGNYDLTINFQTQNGLSDEMTQRIKISPRGFPVNEVFAGNSMQETFETGVLNPVEGSVTATCTIYPSVVEEMVSGMDRMLRQPTGCFEQTSSSNYPNLLVLNYLKNTNSDQKELMEKATGFLDAGYKRLLGFEVKGGGFDWYGNPPAHEGLTAYGLMQFVDMAKIYQVEPDLIDRTATWLLGQRDGKGGWSNSKNALHSWRSLDEIGNAYIVWAMTEAGYAHKIPLEIEKSMQAALKTEDPYLLGLMANVAKIAKLQKPELLQNLLAVQNGDGSWTAKTTSMTNSRGASLTIETTALAALALMENGQLGAPLQKAISFIGKSKSEYGFGSTQSTVLAMKALVEYAQVSKKFKEAGVVEILIDGKKVGKKEYSANDKGAIVFGNLAQYLTETSNVEIRFSKTTNPLPYDLHLSYTTKQPRNSDKCLVDLQTNLQQKTAKMGENIRLSAILTNKDAQPIANPIAVVGIPAGLSVQPWQLKEMQEKQVFDYYELLPDGYIAFHYRSMEANEKREINLDLKADIPGQFEAPASKAYLYYWNEEVVWSQPERVEVR